MDQNKKIEYVRKADESVKVRCLEEVEQDEKYMRQAVNQAKKAYKLGEVPIGCVIVYENKIIGRGYNRRTVDKNTLAHAELTAIRKAGKKLDDWRLEGCTMYVTLEPCQMCSGAIVQARIPRVVVGCMNPKAGCAGSVLNLLNMKEFNHQVELTTGILGEECSAMMKQFFKELRENKKRAVQQSG
ncbi:MAG: tRNA adenosine(34) deaminase TadA [Ruminococcus sp.]|jgi:tRNA(adenine34) deaminase|nr:tRNA adenosine(34) deaminase TadA [Ruminococcus sp.]